MAGAPKKDEAPPSLALQGGANLTKLKHDANDIYKKMKKALGERQAINDQLGAYRETLKSMGLPKSAVAEVMRRLNMDIEQRRAHDFGVQVFGEAVGATFDLFETADDKSDKNPKSAPKASSAKAPAKKAPAKKAAAKKPDLKVVGGGDSKAKEIADRAEATAAARAQTATT